ncbi:MAG: glucodextranase DOMON-like domain-containing protein [Acidobacteriota bacterium]
MLRIAKIIPLLFLVAFPLDAKTIFKLEDDRGDDHGNGLLQYPGRTEFEKGDLDLLSLKAIDGKDGTWFEATFARPIKQPHPGAIDELGTGLSDIARYGFYTFNIDIYIDTDGTENSGAVAMLPGRKAVLDDQNGWEKAIILTPRPNAIRSELRQLMVKGYEQHQRDLAAAEADRREAETGELALSEPVPSRKQLSAQIGPQIDERIFFPKLVRVRGQEVRFFVPDRFLRGPAKADWGYTVTVTGASLGQSFDFSATIGLADETRTNLGAIPVSPGRWKDRFGGGRDDSALQPPIVDMLLPEGEKQESVLSNFDSRRERPAVVRAVVPAPAD